MATDTIVRVNVSQIIAPEPNELQKTGAFISQGGTILGVGETELITQLSDLTPYLSAILALTGLVWASSFGGQVTVTTTANHGIPIGQEFVTEIADCVPVSYNGTYRCMSTGAATFTYTLATNPGSMTTAGTYTPRNVAELVSMATTFFTQGAQQAVYVLELGAGEPAAGVSALGDYITENEQKFYSYLVPRNWDGVAEFIAFAETFTSTTALTYFYVTTTEQNRVLYDDTMKSIMLFIESPNVGTWATNVITNATYSAPRVTLTTTTAHGVAPGQYFKIVGFTPAGYNGTFLALNGTTGSTLIYAVTADPGADTIQGSLVASLYASSAPPATTFDHASDFHVSLNYTPSSTNRVTPFAFSYLYGVTVFPRMGNRSLLDTFKTTNVNYVASGAEGGISNTMLKWGRFRDGRPLNYWYSIDWTQINAQLIVANAVITGSNTPINPLYYNQDGINRLQQALASVADQAIANGLALGKTIQVGLPQTEFTTRLARGDYAGNIVINADPFTSYLSVNPSHYREQIYNGLSYTFTPLEGFISITINITATDFVAA